MPITMDTSHAWLLSLARGHVTYADLEAHLDAEESLRALGMPELLDATGATTSVTADQVRALVHRARSVLRTGPVGPTAIVADDDVLYGMARMYGLLAEFDGIHVGVFRSVADAERWLGTVGGSP